MRGLGSGCHLLPFNNEPPHATSHLQLTPLQEALALGWRPPPPWRLRLLDPVLLAWLEAPQLAQRDEKEIEGGLRGWGGVGGMRRGGVAGGRLSVRVACGGAGAGRLDCGEMHTL